MRIDKLTQRAELKPLFNLRWKLLRISAPDWRFVRGPDMGKKRGQPFRITQSQLREVAIPIGFSAPEIKPYLNGL